MSDGFKAIVLVIAIILIAQLIQASLVQSASTSSTDMDAPTPNDKTIPQNNMIHLAQKSTQVFTLSPLASIEKSVSINIPLNVKICFQPSDPLALTLKPAPLFPPTTLQPSKVTERNDDSALMNTLKTQSHPSIPEFIHSDDFRTIRFQGMDYHLTLTQSRVVERLYFYYQQHIPEIHQDSLLENLEIYSKRLRDVFKNSPAWGTFILRGQKKGTFKLNLA